jgi:hypothetical protein
MDSYFEYGITCQKEDEKELVKRINKFLKDEYNYRKMYKWNVDSISAFNYDYKYCQFIKDKPKWYFDLHPNEDMDGKCKFENKDTQWILFINKRDVDENTEEQNEEIKTFFEELIKAIKYPTIKLYEYKDGEERIGNLV